MYGFRLDENRDVEITNGDIQLVNDDNLIKQSVECILSTDKGEWCLNTNEGIVFENLLGKHIKSDVVKNEIENGLLQIDSSFFITNFSLEHDKARRNLKVLFQAQTDTGTAIQSNINYG